MWLQAGVQTNRRRSGRSRKESAKKNGHTVRKRSNRSRLRCRTFNKILNKSIFTALTLHMYVGAMPNTRRPWLVSLHHALLAATPIITVTKRKIMVSWCITTLT